MMADSRSNGVRERTGKPPPGKLRIPPRSRDADIYWPEVILYLPSGILGGGFLLLFPEKGTEDISIELKPALVRILLALHKAQEQDRHRSWAARGWRPPGRISKDAADLHPMLIPISEPSVRSYLSIINRLVREAAWAHGLNAFALIEHKRQIGSRLARALEVVDGAGTGEHE